MQPFDLVRRLVSEAVGTAFLVATVVGSGIMADRLTDDVALALFCNAAATAAILVMVISLLAPVSGAHFNPVVSLVEALGGRLSRLELGPYVTAQIAGGLVGVAAANVMFGLNALEPSRTVRAEPALWFSETIASFGLALVVLLGVRLAHAAIPYLVALYILAAYWFTASTSFANPAVTIARSMTDTFAGIRPLDVPAFVVAQVVGALLALVFAAWLLRPLDQKKAPT